MNDGIGYKPNKKFIFKMPKEYFVTSVIVMKLVFNISFVTTLLSSGHYEHFFSGFGPLCYTLCNWNRVVKY